MKFLVKLLSKIDFQFSITVSFVIVLFVMIALDALEQFFMAFFAVTVHELAHVLVARAFHVKTEKIWFTPLGEIAVMKNLVFLNSGKKTLVLLAGPFVNLMLGFVCLIFFPDRFHFFRNVNFVIGLFNLMPTYPLDGGKVLGLWLGNRFGTLSGNHMVFRVSRGICSAFILLGFVQAVLYPYNISLICMGLYCLSWSKKEHFDTAFDFYKHVILGNAKLDNELFKNKKSLPVKILAVTQNAALKDIVNMLGYDFFFIFHVIDQGQMIRTLTELEIKDYVKNNGLEGNLQNLIR